jgi:hypothetical protein
MPADGRSGLRHRGGVSVLEAIGRNVGTCALMPTEKPQGGRHRRGRKYGCSAAGAEHPVVATKSGNADGAKGVRRRAGRAVPTREGRSR